MQAKFIAKTIVLSNTTKIHILAVKLLFGVQIKADRNNAAEIYLGASDIDTLTGFCLYPGESIFVPADKNIVADLYFLAVNDGDKISYFTI